MKSKILNILSVSFFMLSSCGPNTPFRVITITSTPTTRTLETSTSLPAPAATETLRAGACAAGTPSAAEIGTSNALSDTDMLREFAGSYSNGTEAGGSLLVIKCEGTFQEQTVLDFGFFDTYGVVEVENGEILLKGADWAGEEFVVHLIPVRWGERKYVIVADRIEAFCLSAKASEFRAQPGVTGVGGIYYLRDGDVKREAVGSPISPSGEKLCE